MGVTSSSKRKRIWKFPWNKKPESTPGDLAKGPEQQENQGSHEKQADASDERPRTESPQEQQGDGGHEEEADVSPERPRTESTDKGKRESIEAMRTEVDDINLHKIVKTPQELFDNVDKLKKLIQALDIYLQEDSNSKGKEKVSSASEALEQAQASNVVPTEKKWAQTLVQQSSELCGDFFVKSGDGLKRTQDYLDKTIDSKNDVVKVLSSTFGHLGQLHWAGLLLSGLAFALSNWMLARENKELLRDTMKSMLLLGHAVVKFVQDSPKKHDAFSSNAVQNSVLCIYDCIGESIKEIDKKSPIRKFLFANFTKELLDKYEDQVHKRLTELNTAMNLNMHQVICEQKGKSENPNEELEQIETPGRLVAFQDLKQMEPSGPLLVVEKGQTPWRGLDLILMKLEVIRDRSLYDFCSCEEGEEEIVLLFVSGIALDQKNEGVKTTETPFKTWTFSGTDSKVCWPSVLFKKDRLLQSKKIRAMTAVYDASKFKTRDTGRFDLYLVAESFEFAIIPTLVTADVPIILVAHSFGGIVIQKMISMSFQRAVAGSIDDQKFLKNLEGIFFYATPFKALKDETYNHFFPDPIPRAIGKEYSGFVKLLGEFNKELAREQSDFDHCLKAIARDYRDAKLTKVMALFELNETILEDWSGIIVEEAAARVPVFGNSASVQDDHFAICRPSGPKDEKYLRLQKFIVDIHSAARNDHKASSSGTL